MTKTGLQSSEFWLTVVVIVACVALILANKTDQIPYIAGLAAVYGVQRTVVKSTNTNGKTESP